MITRPLLRWHGGKYLLAPWIIGHFPKHRVYTECYGGAASVLLRKQPCHAEVYNDLDQAVVNLFAVLRSDRADELVAALELTPFAYDEFDGAYAPADDPVEAARRLVIRSFMGFGSNAHERRSGFRSNSSRSGTTPARDWRNYPGALVEIIDRLRGVVIESRPAIEVMRQHDAPTTLHYVDPPYVTSTRDARSDYAHEMTDEDHAELLLALRELKGMVVLSGYPCELYDEALGDWRREEIGAHADGGRDRREVLWINRLCSDKLAAHGNGKQLSLLETGA